jgi:hypothetical protein
MARYGREAAVAGSAGCELTAAAAESANKHHKPTAGRPFRRSIDMIVLSPQPARETREGVQGCCTRRCCVLRHAMDCTVQPIAFNSAPLNRVTQRNTCNPMHFNSDRSPTARPRNAVRGYSNASASQLAVTRLQPAMAPDSRGIREIRS